MKQILFIIAAIAAVTLSSCNMMLGSGIIVDNEFLVTDFTAVEVGSACKLTITQGAEFSTVITCDDNLSPYLIVDEADGILKINLQPYSSYNHITFEAAVVMPELTSIKSSQASSIDVSGFDAGTDFMVDMEDASYGDINLDSAMNITVNVSDASRLNITSALVTGNLVINCTDASQLDMDECPAADAAVEVSDASQLRVNLNGALTGRISGASSLYCIGRPDISGLEVDFPSTFTNGD